MDTAVISIGDELLIGQVVNTNATWLGAQLFTLGIPLTRVITIGDDEPAILRAFGEAMKNYSVVVVTGGLGPTHDDITKYAACKYFATELSEDAAVLRHIEERWQKRGMALNTSTRSQAMVPRACTVLHNELGTAPGMLFTEGDSSMFILPGVPAEMKKIFTDCIAPILAKRNIGSAIRWRTLNTTGIAESSLYELLGNIDDLLQSEARLAFLPSARGVRMRITAEAESASAADTIISGIERRIRDKAERFIYSADDTAIEEIIGNILRERHLTIATAESCTGGLIANLITNIPGSSEYFLRGYITYANNAKTELLGVPEKSLATHGAVSEEAAVQMALGARRQTNSDIAIATTGIAGPDGGSDEKPVGLLWVGYSDSEQTYARKYLFGGERLINKERFANAALDLLRRQLLGIPFK